jgi:formylglycine-generating enzyme required for sulfatase activity
MFPIAIILSVLLVIFEPAVLQAQNKTAKQGAEQQQAEVSVRWLGNENARIRFGKQMFAFIPNKESHLQLPANERMTVSVVTAEKTYNGESFLTVEPGKGNMNIAVEAGHINIKYRAGTKQQSCIRDIADNMIWVPGGKFVMGTNKGNANEKPEHAVQVKSFYISKYEVTQEQWEMVMGTNPSYFKNCTDCPVENVSWVDANKFVNALNQLTGKHYRLPTEAEWEYAARGGNEQGGFTYSGSNVIDDVAWHYNNSRKKTHPVGQKMPNEAGLYDMTGNVSEWCSDWYDETYYTHAPQSDPKGPADGNWHVLRGGSWFAFDIESRNCYRNYPSADYRLYTIGFRLAADE